MVRNKGDQFAVRNALSIGEDTEGGYAELKAVTVQIKRVSSFADDIAEQIEMVYKAVSTMPPERLVNTILDHAAVDGKSITFYLIGGLYFREEL